MNTYREEKEKTKKDYSKISEVYISDFADDHSNFKLIDKLISHLREKRLLLKPTIDLGSGPGTITNYLVKHGVWNVIAIDITPEFCEYMRNKFKDTPPLSYVNVVEGDMVKIVKELKVSLIEGAAAVVAGFSIIHIPDDEVDSLLKNIYDVIYPEGLFYMSCHEGKHKGMEVQSYNLNKKEDTKTRERLEVFMNYFTEDELKKRIKSAGFVIREFIRYKPAVIPGDIPVPKLQILAEKPATSAVYIGSSNRDNS